MPSDDARPNEEPPPPLRVRLRAGEPAYALFGRLAARNLEPSCRAFARRHRLSFETDVVRGRANGRVAELAGLDEGQVSRHTVGAVDHRWVVLNGEYLTTRSWQPKRSRFCPECFRDDLIGDDGREGPRESRAFRRSWWDVTLVEHCTVHDVAFARKCPRCGHSQDVDDASPWTCRCGEPLTGAAVPRASVAHAFERYVVGRLGGRERIEVPVLDRLPIMGAESLCAHLGALFVPGSGPHPDVTMPARARMRHAGHELLASEPTRLLRELGRLAVSAHPATMMVVTEAVRAVLGEPASELDAVLADLGARRGGRGLSRVRKPFLRCVPRRMAPPPTLKPLRIEAPSGPSVGMREAAAICGLSLGMLGLVKRAGLVEYERERLVRFRADRCVEFSVLYASLGTLARTFDRGTRRLASALGRAGVEPILSHPQIGSIYRRSEAEPVLRREGMTGPGLVLPDD